MQPIDITKLTLEELKVMAYDLLMDIGNKQSNMNILNKEINRRYETESRKLSIVQEAAQKE